MFMEVEPHKKKKKVAYHPECLWLEARFSANLKGAVKTLGDKQPNN